MRGLLCFFCFVWPGLLLAQQPAVVSSASNWLTLRVGATDTVATVAVLAKTKPAPRKPKPEVVAATPAPASSSAVVVSPPSAKVTAKVPAKPAVRSCLEPFAANTNRWLIGKRNGFELEIAKDSYYIRREADAPVRPGRSYIKLPDGLNLNKADTFTVSVEMSFPAGVEADGGLLVGVKDTSNYCQFRLLGTSKVVLYTRVNGQAQASYMSGKPTAAKVAISPTRNTLTIRRTGSQLHFYVNGNEVEDSPHPFKPFKGNGVGFITFAEAAKFQYLTVQVGK